MVGISCYRNTQEFELTTDAFVCFWQKSNKKAVRVSTTDGVLTYPPERYLLKLAVGKYRTTHKSDGIVFHPFPEGGVEDYEYVLELQGYLTPSCLRIVGIDHSLASLGIERGRLFHMYKIGKDTAAIMLLLLHGASRLSFEGYGSRFMPEWCTDEARESLLQQLAEWVEREDSAGYYSAAQLETRKRRCSLPLLGASLSGSVRPTQFVAPLPSKLKWIDVAYRLTLGWDLVPSGDGRPPVLQQTLERFEIAGIASVGKKLATFEESVYNMVTLFFGEAVGPETATAPGPGPETVAAPAPRSAGGAEHDAGAASSSGPAVATAPVPAGSV